MAAARGVEKSVEYAITGVNHEPQGIFTLKALPDGGVSAVRARSGSAERISAGHAEWGVSQFI